MIEKYPTRVTRKRNNERMEEEMAKKREKENLQWTTEPPSCRQAGRPFSASRPPLSHGTWFPSFPFSSFAPYLPSLRPPPFVFFIPSPPFLFVFRGRRGPETDVRTVKNGRRCTSGTGTSPSCSLYLSSFSYLFSLFRILLPSFVDETRFIQLSLLLCIFLPFCHCPARLWPSTRAQTMTQRATCVPDVAQTKRFIIVPRARARLYVCVYLYVWELSSRACDYSNCLSTLSRDLRIICALTKERETRWTHPVR